jgi:hypothetical protein
MKELQQGLKELLESRTQSLRSIARDHDISVPTLTRIKHNKDVSDKTIHYLKDILK